MTLAECLERVSYREFLTWQAWLRDEMNRPTRSDYYQMATALTVARKGIEHPERLTLEQFRLKFGDAKPAKPVAPETITSLAKARWLHVTGHGK